MQRGFSQKKWLTHDYKYFTIMKNLNKILVTGSAGFIGFHLVTKLLIEGYDVLGIDNINDYYDIKLKHDRLMMNGIDYKLIKEKEIILSKKHTNYKFLKADISDYDFIVNLMINEKFDFVVNLAAQAGVRYSIENPRAYTKSNIDGFLSIIEGSRYSNVKHLLYASTSSVYGLNTKMPLSENDSTEHPMAFYAATKKANELIAHSYSHLFNLPTTGLRFFTVYGPWGRPDMALFKFTQSIIKDNPIKVFNNGKMIRDFTYVDDIIESIFRLITKPAKSNLNWDGNNPQISTSSAPYQIFNIGNSSPVQLMNYINELEIALNKQVKIEYLDMQPGDVPATHADISLLEKYIDFAPKTTVKSGINNFVNWYNTYFKINQN
jgi:UDP-glucuronate 4-epimerase